MKFAFSSSACPQWDLQALAANAKQLGYDGVELFADASSTSPANLLLSEPQKVRDIFAAAQIQIPAVATSASFTASHRRDIASADLLSRAINAASVLGCQFVQVDDMQVPGGQSRSEAAAAYARWLRPQADRAADRGVALLIRNALSFRKAADLWLILECVNHPAVGACWDVLAAALAGETPAISIPVLNSRISSVRIADAKIEKATASYCLIGQGDVQLKSLFNRLKGIGYKGCVDVHCPTTNPQQFLADALPKLRAWVMPPAPAKEAKPKPAPKEKAAPAAKPAPAAPAAKAPAAAAAQ